MRRTKHGRHVFSLGLATALSFAALSGDSALAQSTLGDFRILPRLSVLHRTGGIAGISQRLRLSGGYGLEILPPAIYPPLVAFDNAEVWGSLISDQPHVAIVEDVDELLNLEGLHGQVVPVGAPFDVYKFAGKTADGSSIQLHAAVIGPWMYVRGGTTPPVGSADFFEYDLRMVARSRPSADMNDDGVVDAADYTLLRDRQNGAGGGAIDEMTAGVTFDDWREQFGESVPDFSAVDAIMAGTGSSFATATATPEPTAVALAVLGGVALAMVRKQRAARFVA